MTLFWYGLLLHCSVPFLVAISAGSLRLYLRRRYFGLIPRIFLEKPLFVIPRGQPMPQGKSVRFPTTDGLFLQGCYFKTTRVGADGVPRRRGVILFGLEYGSDCWSCWTYVEQLIAAGYDVFAFEPRNQGTSDAMPGYEPLQWLTEYEVQDTRAAVRYLRGRPDADPHGIGFFGVSKGGNAGLYVACEDPYIRCCLTDGAFGTYLVVVPYMRHWFRIYNQRHLIQSLIPFWYWDGIARFALRRIECERRCRYRIVERVIHRLAPRPLMMIHGEGDTYIKPEMAQALFERSQRRQPCGPREFWLVPNAKHNQAIQLVAEEYHRRVLAFFDAHLSGEESPDPPGGADQTAVPPTTAPEVNRHGNPSERVPPESLPLPPAPTGAANPIPVPASPGLV